MRKMKNVEEKLKLSTERQEINEEQKEKKSSTVACAEICSSTINTVNKKKRKTSFTLKEFLLLFFIIIVSNFIKISLYVWGAHNSLSTGFSFILETPASSFYSFNEAIVLEKINKSIYSSSVFKRSPLVFLFYKYSVLFIQKIRMFFGSSLLLEDEIKTLINQNKSDPKPISKRETDKKLQNFNFSSNTYNYENNEKQTNRQTLAYKNLQNQTFSVDINTLKFSYFLLILLFDSLTTFFLTLTILFIRQWTIHNQNFCDNESDIASPILIALFYNLNPFSILSPMIPNDSSFELMLISICIFYACIAHSRLNRCFLLIFYSILIYHNLNFINLGIGFASLSFYTKNKFYDNLKFLQESVTKTEIIKSLLQIFLFYSYCFVIFGFLHFLSFLAFDYSFEYMKNCIFDYFVLKDVTPNIGIFWDFFQLIFPQYYSMFLFIFQAHIHIYTFPLFFFLYRLPLCLTFGLIAISFLFSAYPSVIQFVYFTTLLSIHYKAPQPFFPFVILVGLSITCLTTFCVLSGIIVSRSTANFNMLFMAQFAYTIVTGFSIIQSISNIKKMYLDKLGEKESKEDKKAEEKKL